MDEHSLTDSSNKYSSLLEMIYQFKALPKPKIPTITCNPRITHSSNFILNHNNLNQPIPHTLLPLEKSMISVEPTSSVSGQESN
jgi:hypothetical protein